MKIKINKTLGEHKEGTTITTPDLEGVPTSQYWRRRLADAVLDGCCEVVKESKPKAPPKAKVVDKPTSDKGEG